LLTKDERSEILQRVKYDTKSAKSIPLDEKLELALDYVEDEVERRTVEKCAMICREKSMLFWKLRGENDWMSHVRGMSDGADECEKSIRRGKA